MNINISQIGLTQKNIAMRTPTPDEIEQQAQLSVNMTNLTELTENTDKVSITASLSNAGKTVSNANSDAQNLGLQVLDNLAGYYNRVTSPTSIETVSEDALKSDGKTTAPDYNPAINALSNDDPDLLSNLFEVSFLLENNSEYASLSTYAKQLPGLSKFPENEYNLPARIETFDVPMSSFEVLSLSNATTTGTYIKHKYKVEKTSSFTVRSDKWMGWKAVFDDLSKKNKYVPDWDLTATVELKNSDKVIKIYGIKIIETSSVKTSVSESAPYKFNVTYSFSHITRS